LLSVTQKVWREGEAVRKPTRHSGSLSSTPRSVPCTAAGRIPSKTQEPGGSCGALQRQLKVEIFARNPRKISIVERHRARAYVATAPQATRRACAWPVHDHELLSLFLSAASVNHPRPRARADPGCRVPWRALKSRPCLLPKFFTK